MHPIIKIDTIESVFETRLDTNDRLEFEARFAGENGVTWVAEQRLSEDVLRSTKFRQFYNKIKNDINDINTLRDFLCKQQIEQFAKDSDIKLDDNENQSIKIKVKIGTQTKSFDIEELRSLSYFDTLHESQSFNFDCICSNIGCTKF